MSHIAVRPCGRRVKLFNDVWFSQLRQIAGVPDEFINEGWNLGSLGEGGGKGGSLLAFIGSEYIVKELRYGDHKALLRIAHKYFNHVRNGDTLLSAIFLHFQDLETGRRFYVMRNVLGSGPFLATYDLKGCVDDKTLELFGEKLGASCSTGKVAALNADIVVTPTQRDDVLRKMKRDTSWLVSHGLMDYSLIVGVKTGPAGFVASEAGFGRTFLSRNCSDRSEVTVCVGIIDILQRWTFKKKVAEVIKQCHHDRATIPPEAYATRFYTHFEERFVGSGARGVIDAPDASTVASSGDFRQEVEDLPTDSEDYFTPK